AVTIRPGDMGGVSARPLASPIPRTELTASLDHAGTRHGRSGGHTGPCETRLGCRLRATEAITVQVCGNHEHGCALRPDGRRPSRATGRSPAQYWSAQMSFEPSEPSEGPTR